MSDFEVVRIEIAKLELDYGDTLVIRLNPVPDTLEKWHNMETAFREFLPPGVKLLIGGTDMDLSVLRAESTRAEPVIAD